MTDTPAMIEIKTQVCADMEPLAQLVSVLFDTLNSEAFDILPQSAKASAVEYVAKVSKGV
jgi:hypothetical protein